MQWRRRAGGLDGECQRGGPLVSPQARVCGPRGGEEGIQDTQKREIFDRGMANPAHETARANGKHRLLSLGDGTVPSARHAAWVKVGPLLHFRIPVGRADEWPKMLLPPPCLSVAGVSTQCSLHALAVAPWYCLVVCWYARYLQPRP